MVGAELRFVGLEGRCAARARGRLPFGKEVVWAVCGVLTTVGAGVVSRLFCRFV